MRSPYGMELIDNCARCVLRPGRLFCDLPPETLKDFEALKYATVFPKGALLFVEGQEPRGVFVLCTGRVKLSTCSGEGRVLITQIAEAGEVLGLSATVLGKPYEVTAETLDPCQVNFIKQEDFLRFLTTHGDACLRIARHLSNNYHTAYDQARSLGLSHSAAGKLAHLLLDWCERRGRRTERGLEIKLTLTHEEMAQLIGTSRETVTRLLGEFKGEEIISIKGATMVVRNEAALQSLADA